MVPACVRNDRFDNLAREMRERNEDTMSWLTRLFKSRANAESTGNSPKTAVTTQMPTKPSAAAHQASSGEPDIRQLLAGVSSAAAFLDQLAALPSASQAT